MAKIGICFRVARVDITMSQATEIFENMRSALIKAEEHGKRIGIGQEGR